MELVVAAKKRIRKYKFIGYDMAEIFKAANKEASFEPPLSTDQDPFTSFEEEDKFREQELKRLYDWAHSNYFNEVKLEKWIRDFLKVFIPREKKMHYHFELWVGLAKIKHRDSLLKYTRALFWYMWN
jgi:hypothetical protein